MSDAQARWNLVSILSRQLYCTPSVTFIFAYECGAKLELGVLR
jgi:hypothetical protein